MTLFYQVPRILVLSFFFMFANSLLLAQSTSGTSLHFDFDECTAFYDGSNADYSEFTADKSYCEGCPNLNVIGNSIYRDAPMINRHSCTPGLNGGEAMCVSSFEMCNYVPGHQKSIRFNIELIPGSSGIGTLSDLRFYEKAPVNFDWIDGVSGLNNFPTKYGIRVLVDGQEVFSQSDIDTKNDWSLQEFSFADNPAFRVSETTVFDFELLAYCLINNGSSVSAWDIDDLEVIADCTEINGGDITGGPFEFCVNNGEADMIEQDQIVLTNNNGMNSQWVVTDDQGNILGLPPSFDLVNFDEAGVGTCLVWHLSYENGLVGLSQGNNVSRLEGCYDFSNAISVVRSEAHGGQLSGGPFDFCVGDGVADMIDDGAIDLIGNIGTNSQWVVTDEQGNILGLPPSYELVNFDDAPAGVCLVWHLSFENGLTGATVGNNANDLEGCFSLSNPIEVRRGSPKGGMIDGGPFEFCVGNDEADMIDAGAVVLTGNEGQNSQWVVTDDQGNILGLPPSYEVVNFDEAPVGTCLIWHLSFEDGLMGAEVGNNANELEGCYSLSNPIEVIRSSPQGGTLEGGSYEFCVGDGEADMIPAGSIELKGNSGANSQWVVTDDQGNILGLPPSYEVVNFDDAPAGVCLVWHLSYADGLMGLAAGNNANDLEGCYSLSNPIEVIRSSSEGGMLVGGPFSFCVGDGVADMIPDGGIDLTGNEGQNSQWVVTDDQGNILGLPPSYDVVNFDEAPEGICLVWHLSYADGLIGLEAGRNANEFEGCFSLSNAIEVIRSSANGGELKGGPFEFCVGDGEADMIPAGSIELSGNFGTNSQWVVTDDQGNILGLPPSYDVVNFDEAPAGVCLVWHLSYADGLLGLAAGNNANDLEGCYSLSNPIEVIRSSSEGGMLVGGPFSFCVGDGVADMIPDGGIDLAGNEGQNSQWVVTDDQGNILGLPPSYDVVNFDEAPEGICLVWHLSYADGLIGLEAGRNANEFEGCFSLSNAIEVIRSSANGGELKGGPFEFCVGDGEADMIPAGSIELSGNFGTNSQWVVTDDQGNILGLPPSYDAVNFDEAPAGVCLVWHLSYADGLLGAEVGNNTNDLEGCYSLSNPIEVIRSSPQGGMLDGGPFEFCVGDGEADMIPAGSIELTGDSGANSQWVVTDDQGNILGLPPSYDVVNFDEAPAGVCLVWHLSYADGLLGAEVGKNANDLEGCFSLSNPIEVIRSSPKGGMLEGGPFEFCVGDGEADMIPAGSIELTGDSGANSQWVVTDDQGNILGLPPSYDAVNFDEAPAGVCLVWHLSYADGLLGAEVGNNTNDLEGCFSLSNPIEVIRSSPQGGMLDGGPFEFCVGDGEADMIDSLDIELTGNFGANSQWLVTDTLGEILGLPPFPHVVDFEGAGSGVCLIWHLSYENGLMNLEVGNNASDLMGCYSLSNSIMVNRLESGVECSTIIPDSNDEAAHIKLYPNPAIDEINLAIDNYDDGRIIIEFFDIGGNLISNNAYEIDRDDLITLDLSDLSAGLYYIRIIQNGIILELEKFLVTK